jgi:hypothetical protein
MAREASKDSAPFVVVETTIGKFIVELYWDHAARTAKNFAELSRRGYYNSTIIHRIVRVAPPHPPQTHTSEFCDSRGRPNRYRPWRRVHLRSHLHRRDPPGPQAHRRRHFVHGQRRPQHKLLSVLCHPGPDAMAGWCNPLSSSPPHLPKGSTPSSGASRAGWASSKSSAASAPTARIGRLRTSRSRPRTRL